jgi:hypothetical protein
MLDDACLEEHDFDQVKTSFVKNFFQKLALRNATQFPEDIRLMNPPADDVCDVSPE